VVARTLAAGLAAAIGKPVIVENKGGAGGTIAAALVAAASPDGLTLFVSDVGPITISRSIYPHLTYDPVKDLTPITLAVNSVLNLTVPASHPAKSVAEYIALAKSKPGRVTYASSGTGTVLHMAGELFAMQSGTQLTHVPYRGGAPAVTAVISGEVQSGFNQLAASVPYLRDGRMRSLGVTGRTPSRLAPDVPTIASQGLPDYEFTTWQGVLAPARTPRPVIDYLNRKFHQVLENPVIAQQLTTYGFEIIPSTTAAFSALIKRDAEKWERLVKARNIKPD
jgi:tripartite-type tricarboxylate transporter receptor subunit TctC